MKQLEEHVGRQHAKYLSVPFLERASVTCIHDSIARLASDMNTFKTSLDEALFVTRRPATIGMIFSRLVSILTIAIVLIYRVYRKVILAVLLGGGKYSLPKESLGDLFKYLIGTMLSTVMMFDASNRHFLEKHEVFWINIGFTFTLAARVEDTMRKSMFRILGTIVGGIIGLCGVLIYDNVPEPGGLIIGLLIRMVVFIACTIGAHKYRANANIMWIIAFTMEGLLVSRSNTGMTSEAISILV